jgi:hypothetical protein
MRSRVSGLSSLLCVERHSGWRLRTNCSFPARFGVEIAVRGYPGRRTNDLALNAISAFIEAMGIVRGVGG